MRRSWVITIELKLSSATRRHTENNLAVSMSAPGGIILLFIMGMKILTKSVGFGHLRPKGGDRSAVAVVVLSSAGPS